MRSRRIPTKRRGRDGYLFGIPNSQFVDDGPEFQSTLYADDLRGFGLPPEVADRAANNPFGQDPAEWSHDFGDRRARGTRSGSLRRMRTRTRDGRI